MKRLERDECDRSLDLGLVVGNAKGGSGWGPKSGGKSWRLDQRDECKQEPQKLCYQNGWMKGMMMWHSGD